MSEVKSTYRRVVFCTKDLSDAEGQTRTIRMRLRTERVWTCPEEEGGSVSEEQQDAEEEEEQGGDLWVFVEVLTWS